MPKFRRHTQRAQRYAGHMTLMHELQQMWFKIVLFSPINRFSSSPKAVKISQWTDKTLVNCCTCQNRGCKGPGGSNVNLVKWNGEAPSTFLIETFPAHSTFDIPESCKFLLIFLCLLRIWFWDWNDTIAFTWINAPTYDEEWNWTHIIERTMVALPSREYLVKASRVCLM